MTPDAIRQTLKRWNDAMLECDYRMDEFAALAGQIVESPLGDAVYRVMGELTRSVAGQIGGSEEILEAWWTEHKFGALPLVIGLSGQPMQRISTIDQLADFIIADLARSEQ